MIKEKNNMITKFNRLFEKSVDLTDIDIKIDNENNELVDKIKQELSIITFKKKNSPKTIRIKSINGYFSKRDFKNIKLIYKTYLSIGLSNGDTIKGKLSVYEQEAENNICIKINNDVVYDLDNKKFKNNNLVDKIIEKYKEYLLKNYKILR
jgi:hypothetical protein